MTNFTAFVAKPQIDKPKFIGSPMKNKLWSLLLAAAAAAIPGSSQAHFRLLEPASWLVENQLGDPQKAAPCGGTNSDFGKPTYAVTDAKGGGKIHVKVQETVYHPGHYRVALAVNSPTELPKDPEVTTRDTERGPQSVSAKIQDPPQIPVLADGLFVHSTRPGQPQMFETDV